MFSIFDTKAAVFGTPFFMPREGMAIRALQDLVNDGQSMVNKHPEDFSLYHIGDFEDETASFDSVKPRNLVTASALIKYPSLLGKDLNNAKSIDIDMVKNHLKEKE